ncbi:CRISPR-associated protein Csx16 [Testudinibacter sp. P80/BLE/0925]|uniref:CRISPR-associated protein Csx16 n=1 Tax=Testudinibacter sp. TW-1 TaxID=3417757 RepID=UPI003D36BA55
MATWFISRHQGTVEWMKQQPIMVDHWVSHLEVGQIQAGDIVMGTLPLHLAAQVCQKGAKVYFLSLNVQEHQRGKELTREQLNQQSCRLMPFYVKALEQ